MAQRVAEALARVSAALKSRSWQEGESLGLTPTQADILALLSPKAADGFRGIETHREARDMDKPSDHVPVVIDLDLSPDVEA